MMVACVYGSSFGIGNVCISIAVEVRQGFSRIRGGYTTGD